MIFNPLFLSETDSTQLVTQKSNKLSKNKYLFSDIVKVVMNPLEEQKSLGPNTGKNLGQNIGISLDNGEVPIQLKLKFLSDADNERAKFGLSELLPEEIAELLFSNSPGNSREAISYISRDELKGEMHQFVNNLVGSELIENNISSEKGLLVSIEDKYSAVNLELAKTNQGQTKSEKITVQTIVVPQKSKLLSMVGKGNLNNQNLEVYRHSTLRTDNTQNEIIKPTLGIYSFKYKGDDFESLTKVMKPNLGTVHRISSYNQNNESSEFIPKNNNQNIEKLNFIPSAALKDKSVNSKSSVNKYNNTIQKFGELKIHTPASESENKYRVNKITIVKKDGEKSVDVTAKHKFNDIKNINESSLKKLDFGRNEFVVDRTNSGSTHNLKLFTKTIIEDQTNLRINDKNISTGDRNKISGSINKESNSHTNSVASEINKNNELKTITTLSTNGKAINSAKPIVSSMKSQILNLNKSLESIVADSKSVNLNQKHNLENSSNYENKVKPSENSEVNLTKSHANNNYSSEKSGGTINETERNNFTVKENSGLAKENIDNTSKQVKYQDNLTHNSEQKSPEKNELSSNRSFEGKYISPENSKVSKVIAKNGDQSEDVKPVSPESSNVSKKSNKNGDLSEDTKSVLKNNIVNVTLDIKSNEINNKKVSVKVKSGVKTITGQGEGISETNGQNGANENSTVNENSVNGSGNHEANSNQQNNPESMIKQFQTDEPLSKISNDSKPNLANENLITRSESIDRKQPTRIVKSIELIKEISQFVSRRETGSLSIDIKPEHLGHMKITLDTIDNLLKAKIEVDNEQTKQFMEKNIEKLQDELSENGVKLNSLNISLGNSKQNKGKQELNDKSDNHSQNPDQVGGIEEEEQKKSFGYNTYEYIA